MAKQMEVSNKWDVSLFLEYSAGDKFSLSYLLTVYSESKSAEFIRHRCERWEKERK